MIVRHSHGWAATQKLALGHNLGAGRVLQVLGGLDQERRTRVLYMLRRVITRIPII